MPRKTTAAPTAALGLTLDRARAHWHRLQGLAEPVKGTLEEVVAATGWVRTLGGVDVYLSVRARVPGMQRRDLDAAKEESRLQVIPAVRGCIYLVPRSDVPLVLRVAEDQSRKRTEREHEKVGLKEKELAGVAEAVLVALRKGPLSTDALKKALPAGVVRSLGEAGKKVGISSTLPPALRHLEFQGQVERTLEGGRLDSERYLWRLPRKNPLTGAKVPGDALGRHALLAARFFAQFGPATLDDFASWTALSKTDAKAAMEKAPLAPVAVEGYAEQAWVLESHLEALREKVPAITSVSLLPAVDNHLSIHGGPAPLTDVKHHGFKVPVWGHTRGSTLGDAGHMSLRSVLDGDRLVGLWEYEPDSGEVVFSTFDPLPAKRKKAVQAVAEDLAAFLHDDVGHARSFSLDTMEAVKERAAMVKKL